MSSITEQEDPETAAPRANARDRIVTSSYPLFAQRGVRDVSIDEVIEASQVAKATLYRYFPSKNDLVLAFLEHREQQWTFGKVEAGARARATAPEGTLLAIFDVFDEWFQRDDFEACSFINVMLEFGDQHPVGVASAGYLANIRTLVEQLAVEADLPNPAEFALSWHILMKGSIVQASEGDLQAAKRAKVMAVALIQQFRNAE
ncbi:MAG: TetR/AcrR family transcriptional regulator [Homoserinimonas sp.]